MSHQELITAAFEARPDLMTKSAAAIAKLEQIAPEFAVEVTDEFKVICDHVLAKTAAVSQGWLDFGASVGGHLASTLAGSLASDLYDAAKRGLTSGTNFNRIIESNPVLKGYNKGDLRVAFNTFHRYAPEFTADPNLGGRILERMMETPHDQANIIKDLINARKNVRDVRKSQFSNPSVPFVDKQRELVDSERIKHTFGRAMEDYKEVTRAERDAYAEKGDRDSEAQRRARGGHRGY